MEPSVFDFALSYFDDLQLHYNIARERNITLPDLDLGLRNSILKRPAGGNASPLSSVDSGTVYYVTDYYRCNYIFFELPESQGLFFLGPYLTEEIDAPTIHHLIQTLQIPDEQFSQLQDYYFALPVFRGKDYLFLFVQRLFSTLCGCAVPNHEHLDLRKAETPEEYRMQHQFVIPDDPVLSMQLLEKRYHAEDALLEAVAHGNTEQALQFSDAMRTSRIAPRSSDHVRNTKNLSMVLNTLMRRTAYEAGVHPLYIDSVSGNYATLLERCTTTEEAHEIVPYMVKSYCKLVANHNMSSYSEPVRHILVTVDASLSGDLSLKRFAGELFLNTSYLSALFKKEIGMTLTDYVNQNRIHYAKKLLKSTTLQIQDIATRCGIPDIHYFTRLFKRDTGMSPREWRQKGSPA